MIAIPRARDEHARGEEERVAEERDDAEQADQQQRLAFAERSAGERDE